MKVRGASSLPPFTPCSKWLKTAVRSSMGIRNYIKKWQHVLFWGEQSEKVAGPQAEPGVSYHLPDLDLPSPLWAALRLDGPVPGRLQTCPSPRRGVHCVVSASRARGSGFPPTWHRPPGAPVPVRRGRSFPPGVSAAGRGVLFPLYSLLHVNIITVLNLRIKSCYSGSAITE